MARKTKQTFEDALMRLETITETMQNSVLPLEEALALYQEGAELVRFCQEKLAAAEQVLQVLDDGKLKDWKLDAEESDAMDEGRADAHGNYFAAAAAAA